MPATFPPIAQDVIKLVTIASRLSVFTKTFILSSERAKHSEPIRGAIYATLEIRGHDLIDIAAAFKRTKEQIKYGIDNHKTLQKNSQPHRDLTQKLQDALI